MFGRTPWRHAHAVEALGRAGVGTCHGQTGAGEHHGEHGLALHERHHATLGDTRPVRCEEPRQERVLACFEIFEARHANAAPERGVDSDREAHQLLGAARVDP